MFRRNPKRITERLSSSTYALTAPDGSRAFRYFALALMAGIVVVGCVIAASPSSTLQNRRELEQLQQEVQRLQQSLKLSDMRLQQEVATRQELMNQMEAQSQKLRQADQELQFFRAQKGVAPRKPAGQ